MHDVNSVACGCRRRNASTSLSGASRVSSEMTLVSSRINARRSPAVGVLVQNPAVEYRDRNRAWVRTDAMPNRRYVLRLADVPQPCAAGLAPPLRANGGAL